MAVEVPSESKIYTTKYENFRGVDFTNDPTNIWYRRSPDGKNMLPDDAGRPFKRTGWKVEITADDFRTAAGLADSYTISPIKTYYFQLGSKDYMAIFNSAGLFIYSDYGLAMPVQYEDVDGNTQTFPPTGTVLNPHRSFFFEGNGTSGFYIFAGFTMFRFEGEYSNSNYTIKEVSTKVPTVLISCDATGAGTNYEAVNLLNPLRTVQYSCAGGDKSVFTLLEQPDEDTEPIVKITDASGNWVDPSTASITYTRSQGTFTFSTNLPETVVGEDNLQITYAPYGYYHSTHVVTTSSQTLGTGHFKDVYLKDHGSYHRGDVIISARESYSDSINNLTGLTFDPITGLPNATLEVYDSDAGTWSTLNSSYYTLSASPYNAESIDVRVTLEGAEALEAGLIPVNSGSPREILMTVNNFCNGYNVYNSLTVRCAYTEYSSGSATLNAFSNTSRTSIYGNGIINQVFCSSAPSDTEYSTRVWWSEAQDPTYFPDTNFIEVGSTDTPIIGMMRVGEYLGIIKSGGSTDTAVYLAYPTSFDENTTYAVKQSVNGVGAVAYGAFNILKDETLFLSAKGVMGIEPTEAEGYQLKQRSYYVNKPLCAASDLSGAISFVHGGLYYLCVGNECYVLDGDQKSSWANERTNLQYEAYYLDNIPAQCFAKYQGELWFADRNGNMCRFKKDTDTNPYSDDYWAGSVVTLDAAPTLSDGVYTATTTTACEVGDVCRYSGQDYTVTNVVSAEGTYTLTLVIGASVKGRWSTILDDDGNLQYFKNLQKKGTLVSCFPQDVSTSSSTVTIVKDEGGDGKTFSIDRAFSTHRKIPNEMYLKKKVKKYKRLQFVVENDNPTEPFGVDAIIKLYTLGNYSK